MQGFQTINPFTQQPTASYQFLSEQALLNRLNASAEAYSHWKARTLAERKMAVNKIKLRLEMEKQTHAQLITNEMGKPITQSIGEIEKCVWLCDFYLDAADDLLKTCVEDLGDKQVIHALEPTGVVFGIMPWNFPYWQVFRYIIPNLLLGNVTLLKHAPNSTGCGLAIASLFEQENIIPNIFQTLIIDIPQVETVIAHTAIQGVCVTGSTNAGKAVAGLAGKHLKKSVLELGSSDVFVLLDDAPVGQALDAAFESRILNAGQSCIAAKRVFVPEVILDEAVNHLQSKLNALKIGDPMNNQTDVGPISKLEFADQLASQVKRLVSHGAQKIAGGEAAGSFFQPTLIVSAADNLVNQEEVFGPVINLIPYKSEEELLTAVNNTDFGLGGAVWSGDEQHAIDFATKIETGAIAINDFMKSDPRVPFGGIKHSGYGREMGEAGIRAFANEKVIVFGR